MEEKVGRGREWIEGRKGDRVDGREGRKRRRMDRREGRKGDRVDGREGRKGKRVDRKKGGRETRGDTPANRRIPTLHRYQQFTLSWSSLLLLYYLAPLSSSSFLHWHWISFLFFFPFSLVLSFFSLSSLAFPSILIIHQFEHFLYCSSIHLLLHSLIHPSNLIYQFNSPSNRHSIYFSINSSHDLFIQLLFYSLCPPFNHHSIYASICFTFSPHIH